MQLKSIEAKQINGISIRTNNADEMDPNKGKIGGLHQEFDQQVKVDYASGERVYAIYYDYESDATGDFSVMAGFDGNSLDDSLIGDSKLQTLTIQAGNYLVFSAKGEFPQVIIETWGDIWKYFSSEACEYKRKFTTDFEYYKSQDEIEVCIAVE